MHDRAGCSAAWYELNISAADDCVSACCYYNGPKDRWSDEYRTVEEYWNAPNMVAVREINASGGRVTAGCTGCYFLGRSEDTASYFPDFLTPGDDLTDAQRENWLQAIDDYTSRRTIIRSSPLRYYINFGFACNLSCIMCHQVPRRGDNKRQISARLLEKWKPQLLKAIDITVIGGEPLILVEALHFIRAIIEDPDFKNVQLTICTNGTVHHKHMDLLRKKRKLQLAVSLDTIGDEYETIRVGASWKQVERNIETFIEAGRELGYPWEVQTPCMLLKTNVPRLEDFADWAIRHNVLPGFYDFINARGIEQTFESDNVIAHPQVLLDVPDWEGCFTRAIARLQQGGLAAPAAQLEDLYLQAKRNLESYLAGAASADHLQAVDDWRPLFAAGGDILPQLHRSVYGSPDADSAFEQAGDAVRFRPTGLADHVATPWVECAADTGAARWLRVVCDWPEGTSEAHCRSYLQDGDFRELVEVASQVTGGRLERDYLLDAAVQQVRLVLTADGMKPVLLPMRVALVRPAGPQDAPLIALDEIASPDPLPPPPVRRPGRLRRVRALFAHR